jgi:2-haloacid dehalogenase
VNVARQHGIDTIVFDIGGVLVESDARNLYRRFFVGQTDRMEWFLANVVTPEWNREQDRGRPVQVGVTLLQERFPEYADLIAIYYERCHDMLGESLVNSITVLREIATTRVRLFALTNWSAEAFSALRPTFTFLEHFHGVVVSGEVGFIKPDPAIFRLLQERHDVDPARALYIDDMPANVESAARLGYDTIRFTSPAQLRGALIDRGVLPFTRAD